jgi:trehalose synthase
MIAASLGLTDLSGLNLELIEKVKRAHLLLAMFNALQPGVFALSGWDLCGMLTLPRSRVSGLLAQGDTRWINRAAYDLMSYRPDAVESPSGLPRGTSLYGSLPDQLKDGRSFVSRLRKVLAVRARYRIATSVQVDVPAVPDNALLVMVHLLDTGAMQVTVLNFGQTTINETVTSEHLPIGGAVVDMFADRTIATVDHTHSFPIALEAHRGMSLLIAPDRGRLRVRPRL